MPIHRLCPTYFFCDYATAMYDAYTEKFVLVYSLNTGIPRVTMLMWGHTKKNRGSKNRVNRGYLLVLKGRKTG